MDTTNADTAGVAIRTKNEAPGTTESAEGQANCKGRSLQSIEAMGGTN